jgi:hypothetical protein
MIIDPLGTVAALLLILVWISAEVGVLRGR